MSDRRFVDTNVLLRFLLADIEAQSERARALFEAVERGDCQAWTSAVAVCEAVYVLGSRRLYDRSKESIRDGLAPLLRLPGFRVEQRNILLAALDVFAELRIDFADAYHVALLKSRGETELISFDHDFDRVPGMTRLEPGA